VPNPANPQAFNRYSYVYNNPLRYVDPSGHTPVCGFSYSDPECYAPDPWTPSPPYIPPGGGGGRTGGGGGGGGGLTVSTPPVIIPLEDECQTVTCRALEGDFIAIVDLLIPTHISWRLQGEGSVTLGPGAGPGGSGTLGVNIAYNRYSNEVGFFLDWSLEVGGGLGVPVGGSITTGPIVGWGSSTLTDVAVGDSYIISGTASAEAAVSVAITAPRDGQNLHVDPVYGQVPPTVYGGAGVGSPYAGVGTGISHVFVSGIIDLDSFFP